ncbi:transformer-2 sex-determining protein-like [Armigeres subalbatus]|uniref:transformer-2 sex-determining protein-like n=1 Tax=Armigeres subalbatus TaxID=124917 RepID=UPI002ECFF2D7
MVQARSRSRTPIQASKDHYRRSSRKYRRTSSRRRHHYRSISSPSSVSGTSGCPSYRSTPERPVRPVDPPASKCLGVFGLSNYTKESHLEEVFTHFGSVEKATIVYDVKTKLSRGFGFIYFNDLSAATAAKNKCNGMELHDRTIRVDYSVTKRAHTPTPGVYMGVRRGEERKTRSSYSYRGRSYDDDYEYDRRRPRRCSCQSSHRHHRRSEYRHGHRHRRDRTRDRSPSYSSIGSG